MLRILRAMPELVAMLKGVMQAGRAVSCALMLLVLQVYVFGILVFTLLKEEKDADVQYYFGRLGKAMWTLLVDGSFLDEIGSVSRILLENGHYGTTLVVMIFVLGSALIVMNMLIGVLCEVVSAVAANEKEENAIKLVKTKLLGLLTRIDKDASGMLSRDEIGQVMEDEQALMVLSSLQVNVTFLLEQLDLMYEDSSTDLSIAEIMDFILILRGDRLPTVADMLQGQYFNRRKLAKELKKEEDQILYLTQTIIDIKAKVERQDATLDARGL